jgi:predicted transcriptional regulator
MPYKIIKNRNSDTYKVSNKNTGTVYAYATKNPQKLISAIEIAKIMNNKIKNKKK